MYHSDVSAVLLWSFIFKHLVVFALKSDKHALHFILMLCNLVSIYFHSNEVVKYLQLRELLQWSVMDIFGWNYIHSYICYTKYLHISDYLCSLVVSVWCLWISRVQVPGWATAKKNRNSFVLVRIIVKGKYRTLLLVVTHKQFFNQKYFEIKRIL